MSVFLPLLWLPLSYLDSMFDCFCSSGCHVWLYFKCLALPVLPVKVNVPSQNVLEICYNVTGCFVHISLVVTLTEVYFALIGMCNYVRCNQSVECTVKPPYTQILYSQFHLYEFHHRLKIYKVENDEREWFV